MASNGMHQRRWIAATLLGLAGLGVLLASVLVFAPPAAAQLFDQRYRTRPQPPQQEFFNPFRLLFSSPPRGPQPRTVAPRPAGPAAVDYSRAPPPRKSETPPERTILVMGDSMADWLGYGLDQAFADQPEIGVVRKIHPYSGLVRYDSRNDSDWAQVARNPLQTEKADAVVMMLGLHDRQTIREKLAQPAGEDKKNGARETKRGPSSASYEFRSDKWIEAYDKRIDETIAALKSKGVPVLWVGLPPLRGARSTSDMGFLNDQFRARAERAGIVYVDVWDGFVDEAGKYTLHGPDVEGQERTLRTGDGVHFTKWGARKLAHYVEREIKRAFGRNLVPVAMPSPDEPNASVPPTATLRPGIPAMRPLSGPVVPLTASVGTTRELLGGAGAKPAVVDPTAVRVLVKGDAVAPPRGRADDFARGTPTAAAPNAAAPNTAAANIAAPNKTAPSAPVPRAALAIPVTPAAPASPVPALPAPAIAPPREASLDGPPEPAPSPIKSEPARPAKHPAHEPREQTKKPSRIAEKHPRPVPRERHPAPQRQPFRPAPFDPFGFLR